MQISWWAQELPSDEEYAEAQRNLDAVSWQVDYIITHCAPTSIALMGSRHNEADRLTDFLQEVRERAKYHSLTSACVLPRTFLMMALPVSGS